MDVNFDPVFASTNECSDNMLITCKWNILFRLWANSGRSTYRGRHTYFTSIVCLYWYISLFEHIPHNYNNNNNSKDNNSNNDNNNNNNDNEDDDEDDDKSKLW